MAGIASFIWERALCSNQQLVKQQVRREWHHIEPIHVKPTKKEQQETQISYTPNTCL